MKPTRKNSMNIIDKIDRLIEGNNKQKDKEFYIFKDEDQDDDPDGEYMTFWNGSKWIDTLSKAKRYTLKEVEDLVETLRRKYDKDWTKMVNIFYSKWDERS